MRRSHGMRNKTRKSISVSKRNRGKLKISDVLKDLKDGSKVLITPNASNQVAIPHRRYFGTVGTVKNKLGSCYNVSVKAGNKLKHLIVSPSHLRLVK